MMFVLAINDSSVETMDFFLILSLIQYELQQDQIRFLVLDPTSADLARRYHLQIDEKPCELRPNGNSPIHS